MGIVSFDSPYYPYEKPNSGFNTLNGAEEIPYKLAMYLLDLPDRNGYEPIDDNNRPRVRLIKYLYYDTPNPLAEPLPTPEQKLSLVYDGRNAMIPTEEDKANHPKGYRFMTQNYTEASELDARVLLKCYMGRIIPKSDFKTILGINFETSVNYALDNTMKTTAYSRMWAINQCLIESLHGVNITGIGVVYFNKTIHGDNGYTTYHTEGTSTYSDLVFSIDWQEGTQSNKYVTEY